MRIARKFPLTALAVAAVTSVVPASAASAATLAALQDGNTIVWIDTESKKVTGSVALAGGASLVGIDVRPADGKLYGLAADGAIVTVDVKTGAWQKVTIGAINGSLGSTELGLSDLDAWIRRRFAPGHGADDRPHRRGNGAHEVTGLIEQASGLPPPRAHSRRTGCADSSRAGATDGRGRDDDPSPGLGVARERRRPRGARRGDLGRQPEVPQDPRGHSACLQ